mmetsp:Transcript_38483/g.94659  ORF Transcript_38483/g.94659 Transcript_38483/m.94659 type:complete len:152 (+) Transcript_38483:228-683(+)
MGGQPDDIHRLLLFSSIFQAQEDDETVERFRKDVTEKLDTMGRDWLFKPLEGSLQGKKGKPGRGPTLGHTCVSNKAARHLGVLVELLGREVLELKNAEGHSVLESIFLIRVDDSDDDEVKKTADFMAACVDMLLPLVGEDWLSVRTRKPYL